MMPASDPVAAEPAAAARALRHVLDVGDLSAAEWRALLDDAHRLKAERHAGQRRRPDLAGKLLALIFEKPSTRTRLSFDIAMRELSGESIVLNSSDLQLGRGEPLGDTAQVLGRFVDGVMVRCRSHDTLLQLARTGALPVINGLSDRSHPCQVLADVLTLEERFGRDLRGRRIAWLGDPNNVCFSLGEAARLSGFTLVVAHPAQIPLPRHFAGLEGLLGTQDAVEAVTGADAIVTDTWVSMGDEEPEIKKVALAPYRVTADLMAKAADHAVFLHCLPAYRGQEVEARVIDGPRSVVWDEAENRLHAQKALLRWVL